MTLARCCGARIAVVYAFLVVAGWRNGVYGGLSTDCFGVWCFVCACGDWVQPSGCCADGADGAIGSFDATGPGSSGVEYTGYYRSCSDAGCGAARNSR